LFQNLQHAATLFETVTLNISGEFKESNNTMTDGEGDTESGRQT